MSPYKPTNSQSSSQSNPPKSPKGYGDDMLTLPSDWNPYWRTGGVPPQGELPQQSGPPQQYGPPQPSFSASRYGGGGGGGGFSSGFLNYLADARAMKLRQGEANVMKTGAETGLTNANIDEVYGRTAPALLKMGLTQSQIDEAYGRTAPALLKMGLTQSQIDEAYGRTAPSAANMYATYAGANADLMRAGGTTTSTMKTPWGQQTTSSPTMGFFGGAPFGGTPFGGSPYAAMASSTQNSLARPVSAGGATSYFFGPFGGQSYSVIPAEPSTSASRAAALRRYSDAYDRYLS